MLEIVDLDFKRDAFANTLSRGQTQRLGLARVMLHDPQVLLLDEPLSGLDPRARIEMRNLLKHLGDTGKTVIVSSHILPELADVCNKIGIIDRGVMNVNSTVGDVMKQIHPHRVILIQVATDASAAMDLLAAHPCVTEVKRGTNELRVTLKEGVDDYSPLATILVQTGHQLTMFREEELDLEAAFMSLTKGMGNQGEEPIDDDTQRAEDFVD